MNISEHLRQWSPGLSVSSVDSQKVTALRWKWSNLKRKDSKEVVNEEGKFLPTCFVWLVSKNSPALFCWNMWKTAFPPFQLANEATALAQFGPLALPYGETLATCLDRRLDEASKAAVIAAIGAVQAEQHAGLLVVPWFWVVGGLGCGIFSIVWQKMKTIPKLIEHGFKVQWTFDVVLLGLNSKCQSPSFKTETKLRRFFLNESNIWSMEAVIWKSKISHEANLWKRPIGGWKGAPGGQFYGCRSCSMPSFREAVCCLTSMHGQTRGRRFVASNW